jgi:hypothetical protein
METGKRLDSLDAVRGLSLMLILLFHSSIYNFANIHKIDFSNPPILIVVMSFMALWGGMFVIYSLTANSFMLMRRSGTDSPRHLYRYLLLAGLIYLVLHYILNVFLGRWNIDFVNNQPQYTFIAGTLRNGHATMPAIAKLFEGSSLSTIAWNLILVGGLLLLLMRNGGIKRETRNYLILGVSGSLILLLSFVRVSLYPYFAESVESGHYAVAGLLSFVLANPYPLLPYLSYGLFGAMAGMMLYSGRNDLLKKVILPVGALFFVYGVAGMMNFDKTISKPDYFWYFKTCFELGTFLMLAVPIINRLGDQRKFLRNIPVVRWFSRVSLTVYLFETPVSELLRILLSGISDQWDQTINGCLLFGLLNIGFWSLILFIWSRVGFKYSLDYFWVAGFRKSGKRSTKLDNLIK